MGGKLGFSINQVLDQVFKRRTVGGGRHGLHRAGNLFCLLRRQNAHRRLNVHQHMGSHRLFAHQQQINISGA